MSIVAQVKFVQGATIGVAGRALYGVAGANVVASNGSDSDVVRWKWTMISAPGGSVVSEGVISDGPTSTMVFLPDVAGGYHVELAAFDINGNSAIDRRVFQVPEASGRSIPPFDTEGAALNFGGQLKGWHPLLEAYLRRIDAGDGTANSTYDSSAIESQTTGATPLDVKTFTIPANSTVTVEAEIRCIPEDSSKSKIFNVRRSFHNDAGVITAGSLTSSPPAEELVAALAAAVTISNTGATGKITLTGVAATVIQWRTDYQITALKTPLPAIVVSAITPNTGDPAGGTAVSITVDDSAGATGATVGGVALTSFAIVDPTHVSGVTGAHAAGAVDVQVTNAEGTGTLPAGFTYGTAFDPLDLPEASGTALLWLDPTECTNTGNGTPVTAVVDKAGGTMTIGITGNEPTFQAANPDYNNAPTFDCAAAQGFLLTNTGITGGPWTMVLVCDGTDQVWSNDGNGNYLVNAGGGSGDKLQSRADGAALLVGATAVSGVPGVYIIDFDGATSALYTSAETADATGDSGTAASLAGTALGLLGTYNMVGNGLMGSCRHALIYDGKLSAVDRAYLSNGFGDESGIAIGP